MEDLKKWHVEELAGMYKKAISVVLERSKKYATEDDPFRNFRSAANLAGVTVTQGLLVRIGDKLSRLTNTIDQNLSGEEFSDESLDDTFIDLCNYFIILRNWRIVERRELEESNRQLELFEKYEAADTEPEPEVKTEGTVNAIKSIFSALRGTKVE